MKNRQIKFRVWDIVNKDFTYSPNRQFLIGLDGDLFDGNGCSYDENHIIQQFTGLKDKKGREIYEGDVVEYTSKENLKEKYRGQVKWNEKGFWSPFISIHPEDPTDMQKEFDFEVIGNIFENPELSQKTA